MLESRIKQFKRSMKTTKPSIFDVFEVINELNKLHDQFEPVPADKAGKGIVFVYKSHYINCILIEELGFNSASVNPTYTLCPLSKEEILQKHMPVLNIPTNQNQFELPYLYWERAV